MRYVLISSSLALLLAACGGSDSPSASPQSAGGSAPATSARPNLLISVTGIAQETESCMLRFSAENRQGRRVNLMLSLDASAPDAELSSPSITAAFGVDANGSGQYPDYSISGAPCTAIRLEATQLMCMGADACVAEYRSEGIAGLTPPQD